MEPSNDQHVQDEKKHGSRISLSALFFSVVFALLTARVFQSFILGICFFVVMIILALLQKNSLAKNKSFHATIGNEQIHNAEDSAKRYAWKHFRPQMVGILILSTLIIIGDIFVIIALVHVGKMPTQDHFILMVFLLALPFLLPALYIMNIANRIQPFFMHQMAKSIGFSYAPKGVPEGIRGVHLGKGHSMAVRDLIQGSHNGRSFRMYEFTQTIGHGKGSQRSTYSVFETTLSTTVPKILLFTETPLSIMGAGLQKVVLEGDFGKKFSLFITDGFDSEIRVIFPPDIMHVFIEKFHSYRLEICDNHLYLISARIHTRKRFLETLEFFNYIEDNMITHIESVGSKPVSAYNPLA